MPSVSSRLAVNLSFIISASRIGYDAPAIQRTSFILSREPLPLCAHRTVKQISHLRAAMQPTPPPITVPQPARPQVVPYGEWTSPITSAALTASTIGLSDFSLAGDAAYWLEARPADGGRVALVVAPLHGVDAPRDVTNTAAFATAGKPSQEAVFNVRSRAHEYGGGAYVVDPTSGTAFFSNFADQRVYAVDVSGGGGSSGTGDSTKEALPRAGRPRPVTEADKGYAFADYTFDPNSRHLFCVRETHAVANSSDQAADEPAPSEPRADIVAINVDTGHINVLVTGRDFYAAPRLSSDGRTLAFMAWDHPSMPWDSTGIFVVDIAEQGTSELDDTKGISVVGNVRCVAGGAPYGANSSVSVMEPTFGPNNDLYFISDVTGWWGIHRSAERGTSEHELVFGRDGVEVGGPMWLFGARSFQFTRHLSGRYSLLVVYTDVKEPGTKLTFVDLATGNCSDFKSSYKSLQSVYLSPATDDSGAVMLGCVAGSSKQISRISLVAVDLETALPVGLWKELKLASTLVVDDSVTSEPRVMEFPTTVSIYFSRLVTANVATVFMSWPCIACI
jgi:hypothetical protein